MGTWKVQEPRRYPEMWTIPLGGFRGSDRSTLTTAGGFVPCDIYHREQLAPGSIIDGPAILENVDSTVVIDPGWRARIDEYGNCIAQPV